jgi:hypothetical protein
MMEINWTAPEHRPIAEHIDGVKKKIKATNKRFKQLDAKPNGRRTDKKKPSDGDGSSP